MYQKDLDLSKDLSFNVTNCPKETDGMVMSIMLTVGDRAGAH